MKVTDKFFSKSAESKDVNEFKGPNPELVEENFDIKDNVTLKII